MKNNEIAIICPYFGTLPENFEATKYTMINNKKIDWIIITDNKLNSSAENIQIVQMNFEAFKCIVQKKIGTNIYNVYKLCDYKVLYGKIFEEYINKYAFWGFCDLDMVFGDIDSYLSDNKLLQNYDKIFDLGHFSIIRNKTEINNLYMKYSNYKELLNSEYIYVLDESYPGHMSFNEIMENEGYKIYRKRLDFSDISFRYKNFYLLDEKYKKYMFFSIENKKLFKNYLNNSEKEEKIYVHFQKRKMNIINKGNLKKNFYITPKGIYNEIDKNSFFKRWNYNLITYIKVRIKRFINNKRKLSIYIDNEIYGK